MRSRRWSFAASASPLRSREVDGEIERKPDAADEMPKHAPQTYRGPCRSLLAFPERQRGEHDGVQGGQQNRKWRLIGWRPEWRAKPHHRVGEEERGEHHRPRGEEDDHADVRSDLVIAAAQSVVLQLPDVWRLRGCSGAAEVAARTGLRDWR